MKFAIVLVAAFIAGCDENVQIAQDQCMRREIFAQCMASLPAGPQNTQYNDWSEVVDSCEEAAYWQSKRARAQIRPECRMGH